MRLTCQGVAHSFSDGPCLFSGLTIDLLPGVTTAIVGPSGSGKSTLLSILSRAIVPRDGAVFYHEIHRTSWVFQNPVGVPARTALDHVVLPLLAWEARHRAEAETMAMAILKEFGLTKVAARPFREISGGEAQRLMLARAVASSPDLLLVDEPTGQLDRQNAGTVIGALGALAREGMIVVIATHDPEVSAACEIVVDLRNYQ